MKRLICTVLVFAMVFYNASVCHAAEQTDAVERIDTELFMPRATGRFSISVKAQGTHIIDNVLSLGIGETVRIDASYSPVSANLYVGLVDKDGKFYYASATNGEIDITIEIAQQGNYRLAVVNNSANAVSILGYVYY